jgi:hypothetical protein
MLTVREKFELVIYIGNDDSGIGWSDAEISFATNQLSSATLLISMLNYSPRGGNLSGFATGAKFTIRP